MTILTQHGGDQQAAVRGTLHRISIIEITSSEDLLQIT